MELPSKKGAKLKRLFIATLMLFVVGMGATPAFARAHSSSTPTCATTDLNGVPITSVAINTPFQVRGSAPANTVISLSVMNSDRKSNVATQFISPAATSDSSGNYITTAFQLSVVGNYKIAVLTEATNQKFSILTTCYVNAI